MPLINICGTEIRISGRLIRTTKLEADGFQFVADPRQMIEALRRCGHRIDLFTFVQQMPDTAPKYSYAMEWDNFAILPITTYDDWWTKQIDAKTRNMVRKAEKKGVILREVAFDDSLLRGILAIYNEVPVRQGRPFWHYGKTFEEAYKALGSFLESSIFSGAYFEGSLIGFIKLVHDEKRQQAATIQIISMVGHRDKAPTNALVAQAVRSCAERRISYLIYSRFAYGKKKKSGLTDFKERNGFQPVDLPRYYGPVTALSEVAYRLGLHHRLVDHLPEALIAKVRQVRNVWYTRRMPGSESF